MVVASKEELPPDHSSLTLHAFEWKIKPAVLPTDQDTIHCWGLDRDSNAILIRYQDFPTFCWIELPEKVNGRDYRWDSELARRFIEQLSRSLDYRDAGHAPYYTRFEHRPKLRGYRGAKVYPMIQVCFHNADAQRHCKNILNKGYKFDYQEMKFNMHETKIDVINKMLTARDVEYSGWYKVTARLATTDERISTIKNEYIGLWNSITHIPEEVCEQWTTDPGILAVDIECYSNKHRAMPNESNPLHVTYMISAIYQRYQQPHTRKRYGIVWGDCSDIPDEKLANCTIIRVRDTTEVVNGVEIVVSGEIMLARALAQVGAETDPDIYTGYNILGFDYRYLDYRIKRQFQKWPNMGRLLKNETKVDHKTWQSAAFGSQTNALLRIDGRISVDMMKIVKRDYKLSKYDLNTVGMKFLGKRKHDVSAPEMFVIYEKLRDATEKIVKLYRMYQNDSTLNTNKAWLKKWEKAQWSFEYAKDKTSEVMEYCIQDSELVLDLFDTLNTWIGLVQLSSINRVTIEELFTRGQQIRCYSQLYYAASRRGFVLDDIEIFFGTFAGGMVHEPEPGVHDNVLCLDFASLYPSIIMALNLCWSTLVPSDMDPYVDDKDCHVEEYSQWEPVGGFKNKLGEDDDLTLHLEGAQDSEDKLKLDGNTSFSSRHPSDGTKVNKKGEKQVQKHYRHRFVNEKVQPGILPTIVKTLVTRRRAVNGKIPGTKEELKCLEKKNFIQQIIKNILDDANWTPGEIAQHKFNVKKLIEEQAVPSAITAAKKALTASELLNAEHTGAIVQKYLKELADPEVKPRDKPSNRVVELAKFEEQVAQYFKANDREQLQNIYAELDNDKEQRIQTIKRLATACIVFHQRQLSLKISANSMFGFTGVQNGGLYPCPEIASTITNYGQKLFHLAAGHIKNKYNGKQVYGDTDSVMFQLPAKIRNSKDCNYWGNKLSQEISGIKPGEKDVGILPGEYDDGIPPGGMDEEGTILPQGRPPQLWPEGRPERVWKKGVPGIFPPPLAMEFEKAMRLLCIKKKKYAAYLIGKDGNFKLEDIMDAEGNVIGSRKILMTKGIVLARRDNCRLVRIVYEKILPIVLDMGSLADAMDILIDHVQLLYNQQIPLSDLAIVKELGSHYKLESNCMNVFARNLRDKGIIVTPGDRLDFVVVQGNQSLLGNKMRLLDQLNIDPEPIDVNYYMEKALMNPINQLISIGFKDTLDKLGDVVSILKPRARNRATLREPVKFLNIVQQYPQECGKTLADVRNIIRYNVEHIEAVMELKANGQTYHQPTTPQFNFVAAAPTPAFSFQHLPAYTPQSSVALIQPMTASTYQPPVYTSGPAFNFNGAPTQHPPQFSFTTAPMTSGTEVPTPQFNFYTNHSTSVTSYNNTNNAAPAPFLIY